MHIYVITVMGNCERQATYDGYRASFSKGAGRGTADMTVMDVWAYTKEEACRIASVYGKVLACYIRE